ncbi:unnamed protein product [Prunus brigantina]
MQVQTLRVLYYFLLLASIAFKPSSCSPGKRFYVVISNNLENKRLDFSCESLNINGSLPTAGSQFDIVVDFEITKQFNCDLRYSTYHATIIAFRDENTFAIDCGGVYCIWSAKESGIYLVTHNGFKKMYDWGKQIMT